MTSKRGRGMVKLQMALAMAALGFSMPLLAAEAPTCGPGLICASKPQSIVEALQKAGYKAVLSKSDVSGNPKIDSAASGYNYSIYFYGCEKAAACTSLHFEISFEDDGANTPELANKWNKDKRFLQMSVADDHTLAVGYDVTTVGGLNGENFADVIDWWSSLLGEVGKFFKENPAPKKS